MSDEVYRFVDFYELHEIIVNKKLKMHRLALMDDKNEGLGEILKFQESMASNLVLRNQEDIVDFHKKIKGKTYISSWTSKADLMAMWLLYSEYSDAIRIKTTQNKLAKTLKNYWDKNYWTKHVESAEGTLQLDSSAIVADVIYVSFEGISNSIKEKHKFFFDACEKGSEFKMTSKQEKLMEEFVINEKNGVLLKDKAFSHEEEVRAFFSICLRNNVSESELAHSGDSISKLFGLATHHHPHYSKLPDIINIPIVDNFVESLCFDPRMPKYKKEMIIEILSPYIEGIEIEESNVFGYKPEEFSFIVHQS